MTALASLGAGFVRDVLSQRALIAGLVRNDFRSRYLGSYLGFFWALANPAITVLIFWFVFEVGFKFVPVEGVPFILWFLPAVIPWFFFADALGTGTGSVTDNQFLVKKVVFRVSTLPLVKVLSAAAIHLIFIAILLAVFLLSEVQPTLYWLQILYYSTGAFILALGSAWIAAALNVFFRDVQQVVTMLLQFGFWLTPVFWSIQMLPEKYHLYVRLNPLEYLVNGYRGAMLSEHWFWERPLATAYFWFLALLLLGAGAYLFHRLRPHFADVL